MKSCDKVLSLSVMDPLMKILSGLEYILRKAQVMMMLQLRCACVHICRFRRHSLLCIQDWEAYAASQVSLCTQLEALTQLILDWRRMELKYVTDH